ncbi:MAG: SPOR domain-containing protein [bacterium]
MKIFSRTKPMLIACIGLSVLLQMCDSQENFRTAQTQADSTYSIDSPIFTIQIAAMRDKHNAEKLNDALKKTGLSAYIFRDTTTVGDSLFKVRIGRFASEIEAQVSLDSAKEAGYTEAFLLQEKPNSTEELDSDLDEATVKKQLTFAGDCSAPSWSPSNREIAFYKGENFRGGIYSIGTGGGHISKIVQSTENRRVTKTFAWSPSGKHLAFSAIETNKDWEPVENLFIIDKNGSNQQKIVNQERLPYDISTLLWSPDENSIAFNANYGKSDSWSDLFQMVKIISFGGDQRPTMNDLASTERINSVLGWKSNGELLFAADYDDVDRLGYEIWSYELSTRRRRVIARGPVLPEFAEIVYLASENLIVYTSLTSEKMMSLDLATGEERILFVSQLSNASGISSLTISDANELFFLSNNSLLKRDRTGQIEMADLEVPSRYFALAPRGEKVCFAENGDLFTIKLPFKRSPMNTK